MPKANALKENDAILPISIPDFESSGLVITTAKFSTLTLASETEEGRKLQVRKSDDTADMDELVASIRNGGITHHLITFKSTIVIAGNRRLKALRIIADGNPDFDPSLPVIDATNYKGDLRELALATNLSLPPHPVDRFEVLGEIYSSGSMTREQIMDRHALTGSQLDRILAIAQLAPIVRNAWRNNEIDRKTAVSFALTNDHKEQEKLFKKLAESNELDANDVRQRLSDQKNMEVGKLLNFVGHKSYQDAGGEIVRADLFGMDHVVKDRKLLEKLARDKIEIECKRLLSNGWGFALPRNEVKDDYLYQDIMKPTMKPTADEQAQINSYDSICGGVDDDDEFTPEQEAAVTASFALQRDIIDRAYKPEEKAKAGCFVELTQSGDLRVHFGKIKPAEFKKMEQKRKAEATAATAPKKSADGKVELKVPEISNALAGRISTQLQEAISKTIVKAPNVALAAVIGGLSSMHGPLDVKGPSGLKEVSFETAFSAALRMNSKQQLEALAGLVSKSISIFRADVANPPLKDSAIRCLVDALDQKQLSAAISQSFNAAEYFEAIPRSLIVQIVAQSMGPDHAANVAKMDKPAATKFAIANVPKTGWLAPQLQTRNYRGPVVKKAAAKSAPAKKKPAAKKAAKKK